MLRNVSTFLKFSDYLHFRRIQAERSLLIQINDVNSIHDVNSYLVSQFGQLASVFHYTLPAKSKYATAISRTCGPIGSTSSGQFHWVLAEFKNPEDFSKAIHSAGCVNGTLPYSSSMCWYTHGNTGKPSKSNRGKLNIVTERFNKPIETIDFSKTKSLNDQLLVLENSLKITELGVRVRFLVAHHLEQSLNKFFPEGCIVPFGSTVSGIGRLGGDLDLVLLPDKTEIFPFISNERVRSKDYRLRYQTKLFTMGSATNSRFQVQRVMETVADMIQLFVPGCTQVQRILQARVPLLRFWSEYTDIQCDFTMTNSTGIHMSELIYIMTCLDPRFVSLLFAIRSWASARKITNPNPGRQPTNFMLVLLLIYFLQCQKILPTFDILFNNTSKEDERVTVDAIQCTFLRDPAKILTFFTPQNEDKLAADLLFQFFEFYSEFDFTTRGISLFTGSTWGKPDSGALYIQNPLERHLNVARNVSKEETSKFKSECCAVLWKLETSLNHQDTHPDSDSPQSHSHISLQDILLTPLQKSSNDLSSLRIKDLLID